jgi:hypothetical protein
MWEPQHLTIIWASTARYEDTFTFTTLLVFSYLRHDLPICFFPSGFPVKAFRFMLCVLLPTSSSWFVYFNYIRRPVQFTKLLFLFSEHACTWCQNCSCNFRNIRENMVGSWIVIAMNVSAQYEEVKSTYLLLSHHCTTITHFSTPQSEQSYF